jgi:5,10-methylene-tetrahydrofolate dehydrogenase/methenyl tetrahydrofolate cyclohydrolase
MVKDGVVVIDVGITCARRNKGERVCITGDVDFENVSKKAFYYSCSWWRGPHDDVLLKIRCWQEK